MKQLRSGDSIRIRGGHIDFSCCDCGLTHRLNFDRDVVVTIEENKRSTGQRRRAFAVKRKIVQLAAKIA